jgi:hypothetical protein
VDNHLTGIFKKRENSEEKLSVVPVGPTMFWNMMYESVLRNMQSITKTVCWQEKSELFSSYFLFFFLYFCSMEFELRALSWRAQPLEECPSPSYIFWCTMPSFLEIKSTHCCCLLGHHTNQTSLKKKMLRKKHFFLGERD